MNQVLTNKGYNKLLYEKRIELGLSKKEAAKKLKIFWPILNLVENGYITLPNKLKQKFIEGYGLEQDFFENDLGYPVMISEDKTKIASSFIRKLSHNRIYKIACGVLAAGFLAMSISGVACNVNTKNSIPSLFNNDVLETRNYVLENPDDVIYDDSLKQNQYFINNNDLIIPGEYSVTLAFYESDQEIPYPALTGSFFVEEIVPFIDPIQTLSLDISYSSKIKNNGISYTAIFTHEENSIARCQATESNGKFSYTLVAMIDETGRLKALDKTDPKREDVTNLFEQHVVEYKQSLVNLFAHHEVGTSYSNFVNGMIEGNQNLKVKTITNSCLLLFGIIFAALFFALSVLSFFKRDPLIENKDGTSSDASDDISLTQEVTINKVKEPLKKNWKFFTFLPGSLLRLVACVMILTASLGIFFLFKSITTFNVDQSMALLKSNQIFSSFLVIAFILMLFAKIDIIQEKKNYFMSNYFYFFSGLALYLVVLSLSKLSVVDTTIRGNIENVILNVLPGNFLWGFLAFNMAVFLLFYRPISYGNDQKKLLRFRCLAIIPFAYLLVSLILGLLDSCAGVKFPFWLSFLFFTKSTYLIVFVMIFTIFCFIYKRYTIKKFGPENAQLFQKGNKYYLVKNSAASILILLIGIFELIFYFAYPTNPAGFGGDVMIFIALPLVMLYHPHHGKRNPKVDNGITFFYGFAYVIGIALILLSVLDFIIKYL